MESFMRIDKFLADMSIGTRSEIKKLIHDGRVSINGEVVQKPNYSVDIDTIVVVDDIEVHYSQFEYYILNKPSGYLCTIDYSPNVLQLIETYRKDVMPVGRLDKDTEGLLLLTNDGQLAHKLLAPKSHVNKTYYVETDRSIPDSAIDTFCKPIEFEDFISKPAKLEIISSNSGYLTISEGKFHQVKRMFKYIGCEVTYLKRTSFGPLKLNDLEIGEYRSLSEEEINMLKGSD